MLISTHRCSRLPAVGLVCLSWTACHSSGDHDPSARAGAPLSEPCVDGSCSSLPGAALLGQVLTCWPDDWRIVTADPRGEPSAPPWTEGGAWTSIAVDDSGGVHISYILAGSLQYAYRRPDYSSALSSIGPADFSATSIALDSSGGVHIGFTTSDGQIAHAYHARAKEGFDTIIVDEDGRSPSLAVDAGGGVHMSYHSAAGLRYAYRPAGGAWTQSTVQAAAPAERVGMRSSLALSDTGAVHISHVQNSGALANLAYSHRSSGGSWTTTVFGENSVHPWATTAIALNASGRPHIVYFPPNHRLTHMYQGAAGTWSSATIDWSPGEPDGTGYPSLAVDVLDNVHVSYWLSSSLKHAYLEPAGVWTATHVDRIGTRGRYSSVAVNASGDIHIAYQNVTRSWLMHARKPRCRDVVDVVPDAPECDDGSYCTWDVLEPDGTCRHEPIHERCDDGDACTGDTCEDIGDENPMYVCFNEEYTPVCDPPCANGQFCYGDSSGHQCIPRCVSE